MDKLNNDSDKPQPRLSADGFSLSRWLKKVLSRTKPTDLSPEEREKAIEESIEEFASQVSYDENVLEEDEREMIHGVVELGETTVKEIMVPRVDIVGVPVGTSLDEIIETIKKSGHTRIPLYENSLDEIKGILYAKDLLSFAVSGDKLELEKITRDAYFIPETLKIDDLLREMRKKKLHIAIVVDEYGGTSGLATMEDIIEEIIGEIEDEYDLEPPPIIKVSDDIYMVDGTVTISDLNEKLDLKLPEEEFETVGGLIYDLVGSLPEKGQVQEYMGIRFVVHEIEGQRIVKVKIMIEKKDETSG